MSHDDEIAPAPVPAPEELPLATRRSRTAGDLLWRNGRLLVAAEYADGPLPSARELKRYREADPRAPRIILDEFRTEGQHRRELERELVAAENRRADRGQVFALVVMLVGLCISALLIHGGHDWAGAAVGGANLLSMGTIFIALRHHEPGRSPAVRPALQ